MRKPFNLRVPVLYSGCLALGIVYAVALAYFGIDGVYTLIPVAAFLTFCVIYGVISKNLKYTLIFIIGVIIFAIGTIYAYAMYFKLLQPQTVIGEYINVEGTVEEVGLTSSNNRYLIIKNLSVNGKEIGGKLYATLLADSGGEYCRRGYSVKLYAALKQIDFFSGGEINYLAVKGVKYTCAAAGIKSTYRFSLLGEISYAIEKALYANLEGETAAVCLAMLTGNTDAISAGTLASFRNGGIAHVFAVSGLHIGVLYGLFNFIFKRTGGNRWVAFVVKIAIITLYAGVCGFSASSVRAVICCAVADFSRCAMCKYDAWNALSLAAFILLLINPLYIFGTGFVLSFAAMLGIVLIYKNANRLFSFLPKKLGDGLALGVAVQFGTAPAFVTTFNYVSVAGLLLNVFFIPLLSLIYVLLFFSAIIAAVIPKFGVLLSACAVPLELVIDLVVSLGFENAIIKGVFGDWLFVPFIAATLAFSDKFNFKIIPRTVIICSSLILISLAFIVNNNSATSKLTFNGGYAGGNAVISSRDGSVLILTSNYRGSFDYVPEDINSVVILGDNELSQLFSLGERFENIYLDERSAPIPDIGGMHVFYSDKFETCGVNFEFNGNVLSVESEGVNFCVVCAENGDTYGDMPQLTDFCLYCYGANPPVLFADGTSYNLQFCGSLTYKLSGDKYTPLFTIPKE